MDRYPPTPNRHAMSHISKIPETFVQELKVSGKGDAFSERDYKEEMRWAQTHS